MNLKRKLSALIVTLIYHYFNSNKSLFLVVTFRILVV